ncbi:microtubule-associated protein YTM1 [Tirmania nivea]|nr:microtubule-associated protein YTM1 [Tirmania nivea]
MPSTPPASAPLEQGPQQVQIKLTTRHSDIAISSPAPLLVPTSLRRYGLSQIVNHLLETPAPVPFDFLIDGVFLKTNLDDYLTANGLSAESTLTLEYVRSVLPPVFKSSFVDEDWVSSVAVLVGSVNGKGKGEFLKAKEGRVLAGGYDGVARVWDVTGSGRVVGAASGHQGAVKTVGWIAQKRLLTGSVDQTVRLWGYDEPVVDDDSEPRGVATPLAEFLGHKGVINSLSIHPPTNHFLTASSDGTVGLWSTNPTSSPPAPAQPSAPRHLKKRKTTSSALPKLGSLAVLSQPNAATSSPQPVSAAIFHPHDPTVSYSATWSHTLLTHDLTTTTLASMLTTPHPILSLTTLPSLSLLAAGSSARHITLHDPRASAATISQATLRGHTNAVVSLSPAPDSEFLLASGSHDGTVRIWDVRAVGMGGGSAQADSGGGSLFTIKRESGGGGKVFAVQWEREVGIVSGGEDRRVQVNTGVEAGGEGGEMVGVL